MLASRGVGLTHTPSHAQRTLLLLHSRRRCAACAAVGRLGGSSGLAGGRLGGDLGVRLEPAKGVVPQHDVLAVVRVRVPAHFCVLCARVCVCVMFGLQCVLEIVSKDSTRVKRSVCTQGAGFCTRDAVACVP